MLIKPLGFFQIPQRSHAATTWRVHLSWEPTAGLSVAENREENQFAKRGVQLEEFWLDLCIVTFGWEAQIRRETNDWSEIEKVRKKFIMKNFSDCLFHQWRPLRLARPILAALHGAALVVLLNFECRWPWKDWFLCLLTIPAEWLLVPPS